MWELLRSLERRVNHLEDLYLKQIQTPLVVQDVQISEPKKPDEQPRARGWPKGKPRKKA